MPFDPTKPPVVLGLGVPIGGTIREEPQDFVVEEIPLYEPSGEGEHLMVFVEKTGITTPSLLRLLSQKLGIRTGEIGYAGLKDRHAVTRQWLTVPRIKSDWLADLALPGVRILEQHPHRNKLKLGHLRGNRFRIRVRVGEAPPRSLDEVQLALGRLESEGVPNAFGPQRFGSCGQNHRLGEALLVGDAEQFIEFLGTANPKLETPRLTEARQHLAARRFVEATQAFPGDFGVERQVAGALARGESPDRAVRAIPPRLRDFLVSAWQSSCFNEVLAARIERGAPLLPGDVAMKHVNGACFMVEHLEQELPRARALEISATGPLPGPKMLAPTGEPGRLEAAILERYGHPYPRRSPLLAGAHPPGGRRALRVPITDAAVTAEPDALVFTFTLPRGSFATAVLALFQIGTGSFEASGQSP